MTMIVKLVRYTFPDDPDWLLVGKHVPLGTKYEVWGYHKEGYIGNDELGRKRETELYLLLGNEGFGWMPTVCFEFVQE